MSNIIIATPDGDDEFRDLSNDELRRRLSDSLGLTAKSLLRSARLVGALERRGEDLSGLKIGILNHLRKIACGQLLPEVLVRYAAKPSLVVLIGNLPITDQQRLVDGELVRLLLVGGDGRRDHVMADPLNMRPHQVSQAFARDHIRTEAEQYLILVGKQQEAKRPLPQAVGNMRIDDERDGVMVGRLFIPLADLETAVALLRKNKRKDRP